MYSGYRVGVSVLSTEIYKKYLGKTENMNEVKNGNKTIKNTNVLTF